MKQRNKADNTGSEIRLECQQSYRRNFKLWECDTAAVGESLRIQPLGISKDSLTDTNGKVVVMKRMNMSERKCHWQKKLLEILHNIENTKDKMLETDTILERSTTIHQGIEKFLML